MRIDKFLKVSRIIKRRQIAKEFCDQNKVQINGKIAKPGDKVEIGDIIRIQFGIRIISFTVLKLSVSTSKSDATNMYKEHINEKNS